MISHSNPYCESIFSAIRKICTNSRHNLGKDTRQNHASTRVSTEKSSIRNNTLGIPIPKINIFGKKKLPCYEWEPPKPILAQAKSAAYKILHVMKKQQEATANEDPDYVVQVVFYSV